MSQLLAQVQHTHAVAFTDGPRIRRAPSVTPEGLPYRAPTEQDGRGFNKHSHASLAQFQSAPPFELPTRGTR